MTSKLAKKIATVLLLTAALGACASAERPAPTDLPSQNARSGMEAERLLETAWHLLEQERYGDAAPLFGQVLEHQTDNANAKLGLAESYLGSGAVKMALAAFTELSEIPEIRLSATQGQGLSLVLLGRCDKAQEVLSRVVDADPASWRAWNALGRCHDSKENWIASTHAYEMALKVKPDAYAVLNNFGMSLLSQSRHGEAEARFLDALALRPDFETARNNLRFSIAMQGRYRDAFAGALRQNLPTVLNNVGYAAMLRGDRDRAQAYFSRAMEASPHFLEVAYENLQRAKGQDDRTN